MTPGEMVTAIVGGIVTIAGGFFALVRWFVTVWRDIRREELSVARESAAAQRADANRTIEVQIEQAAATASLSAKVENIPSQVAALMWREHTPPLGVPLGMTVDDPPARPLTSRDPHRDTPSERRRQQIAAEQRQAERFPGDRPPGRPGRRND